MAAITQDEMARMLNDAVRDHMEELTGISVYPGSVRTTVYCEKHTAQWLDSTTFTIEGAIDTQKLTSGEVASRTLGIKRVIFNDPCTIVLWKDGTKPVFGLRTVGDMMSSPDSCCAFSRNSLGIIYILRLRNMHTQ